MATDHGLDVFYWQQMLGNAQNEGVAIDEAAKADARPSTKFRPGLSIDGNKWRALYGSNLQDGVAGFGDSPAEAMSAFDAAWVAKLPG